MKRRNPWSFLLLAGSVLLVLVAMSLSSTQLSELRVAVRPLSHAMSWLEGRSRVFDLDHVAFFLAIGAAWTWLLGRRHRRWLLALPVLAGATELLQFGVPGRTPRWTDWRDDLIGMAVGIALARVLAWLLARVLGRVPMSRWGRGRVVGQGSPRRE